ncbi:hypothetical protein [Avibacterium paragallinarum]|uniref:hypothetical protein n=1 Tax=Avibacterium paragallinarum TaxID=728 RepID=UPI001C98F30B|nr:hypothetical protein [Avibacterium paragallinarum]QZP16402.1 hypothetical protein K5O18_03510 [Avibacterium paragallinarum]
MFRHQHSGRLNFQAEVNITVFSTQAYPIQNAQLAQHLYHIDRVEQWEDALNKP